MLKTPPLYLHHVSIIHSATVLSKKSAFTGLLNCKRANPPEKARFAHGDNTSPNIDTANYLIPGSDTEQHTERYLNGETCSTRGVVSC